MADPKQVTDPGEKKLTVNTFKKGMESYHAKAQQQWKNEIEQKITDAGVGCSCESATVEEVLKIVEDFFTTEPDPGTEP